MVKVSIAIRAFRRRWLGDAIASVLRQTFRDLELIVYDDAGDLHDVVSAFDDPRVHYVPAVAKLHASGRFLAAIEPCRGAYVGLLDDDDFYEPNFVERLAATLDEHPRAGAAIGRERHLRDGATVEMSPGPPGRQEDVLHRILQERFVVSPSATLYRRAAIGPMPDGVSPDLFMNATLALAGWEHVVVDEILVNRRMHRGQISRSRTCADYAASTYAHLRIDDRELDKLRRRVLARRKLIQHAWRWFGPVISVILRRGDAEGSHATPGDPSLRSG